MRPQSSVLSPVLSLIAAVKTNNISLVGESLVAADGPAKFLSQDRDGNSALHWAVKQANADIFNLLIKHLRYTDEFATIAELKNSSGETALQLACQAPADTFDISFVKALLHDKTDLTTISSAVIDRCKAAYSQQEEKIENHEKLSTADAQQLINTLFLHAVKQGQQNQTNDLYQAGAQIECTDEDGNSALMLAAQYGHKEMLIWLDGAIGIGVRAEEKVAAGEAAVQQVAQGEVEAENRLSDLLKQKNQFGFDISAIARIHGHYSMVEEIFGGQLFQETVAKPNLILEAAKAGSKAGVEEILKEDEQLGNCFFSNGEGLVLTTVASGDVDTLQFLVNTIGPAALYDQEAYAKYKNYQHVKQIARQQQWGDDEVSNPKPRIHFRNDNMENPVLLAAKHGQLPMLKYLVEQMQRPLAVHDALYLTPLHKAAENGHLHVVRWLVDEQKQELEGTNPYPLKGMSMQGKFDAEGWRMAEARLPQEYNWSALDLAVKQEHFDIVLWAVLVKGQKLDEKDYKQLKIAIQYHQQICGQIIIQQLISQQLEKTKANKLLELFDSMQRKVEGVVSSLKSSGNYSAGEGVQPQEYLLPGIIAGYQACIADLVINAADNDKNEKLVNQLIAKFKENIATLTSDLIVALLAPANILMCSGEATKVQHYHQILLKQFESHSQLAELKTAIAEQLLNSQLRAEQLAPEEKIEAASSIDINTMARAVAALQFLTNNPTPAALALFKQVSQSLLADEQKLFVNQESFKPQAWQLFQAHYGEEAAATVLESIKNMQGF